MKSNYLTRNTKSAASAELDFGSSIGLRNDLNVAFDYDDFVKLQSDMAMSKISFDELLKSIEDMTDHKIDESERMKISQLWESCKLSDSEILAVDEVRAFVAKYNEGRRAANGALVNDGFGLPAIALLIVALIVVVI